MPVCDATDCMLCNCNIPKEGVCIAFSPSGLRTPQRAMSGSAGRAATQAEPFCDEALAFTREHCLQREVSPAL